MESIDAVSALGALAQESRLQVFRLLVRTGTQGLAAGEIAEQLGIQPATLSFHLAQLRNCGLISMRRAGRSLIYAADYEGMNELMNYLTENCCAGTASCSVPICEPASGALVHHRPRKRARQ